MAVNTNKAVFQKTLILFWTATSVNYENVIDGLIKYNTSDLELRKGKTEVGNQSIRSLYIFEITKYTLNSYLENLISFSVIYRFIGLRDEITEIFSINRKHRSN